MSDEEAQAFVIYTKGLKDLAQHFRCEREVIKPRKAKNLSKKKITEITTKLIFGVGQ